MNKRGISTNRGRGRGGGATSPETHIDPAEAWPSQG